VRDRSAVLDRVVGKPVTENGVTETTKATRALPRMALVASVPLSQDSGAAETMPSAGNSSIDIGIITRQRTGGHRSAYPQILRRCFAPIFHLFITHLGTLVEVAEARFLDGGDVHKDILAAVVGLNEAKALVRIEPLHCTCRHVHTPRFRNNRTTMSDGARHRKQNPPA
jgi:hypothetical protein